MTFCIECMNWSKNTLYCSMLRLTSQTTTIRGFRILRSSFDSSSTVPPYFTLRRIVRRGSTRLPRLVIR
jgi:hypothetical protein